MKLSLAIDNCFAKKRWTRPEEWMEIVRGFGLQYVEASADTEIDPLYSTPAFLSQWVRDVEEYGAKAGVRVANLYSGHGTYSTLGLGHYDAGVRRHLAADWVNAMLGTAGALNAGLGFYAHAFDEYTLDDPDRYRLALDHLMTELRLIALTAAGTGVSFLGVEQMYAPHQIPWTLEGAGDFLRRANRDPAGRPVYLTLDTGHMSLQRRFLPPSPEQLAELSAAVSHGQSAPVYFGTRAVYEALCQTVRRGARGASLTDAAAELTARFAYQFSTPEDAVPLNWLERFGAFAPIIHLQQTDGHSSGHQSFTAKTSKTGIIHAPDVLRALQRSASQTPPPGFPPKIQHVYLTLEPFLPTACNSRLVLDEIAESARYWRRYVPVDNMDLSEAIKRLTHD